MLFLVWSWRDWANLSALRLPDTDDAMRLQQIRDWLGGQAFADLSQHRIAGGLSMHWSRLPDLVPGGLIALLTPIAGRHGAELTAVILWPGVLFATALYLVARIARRIGAPGGTAMLVAALAYPATGLFLPGRIDHHGLQMALLLGLVLALLGPPTRARGVAGGVAAAASLVVGLETAPLIAAALAAAGLEWQRGEHHRLAGLAAGYGAALAVGFALLRPQAFGWPGCDGFTATAFRAECIAALALAALVVGGRVRPAARSFLLIGVASTAAMAIVLAAPGCLRPYGGVDPWLAQVWLSRVAEAQPLFAAPSALAIGQAGLAMVGLAATGWCAWRQRTPGWIALFAISAVAVALSFAQLRAINAAALLAAPGLSAMIAAARVRGTVALLGAWTMSAGILYPLAAKAFEGRATAAGPTQSCADADVLLSRLPPGALVIAPPDVGAYGITATRLRFLAAPYHRNNAGNLAAYRFFLSNDATARRIAQAAGASHVLFCGDLGGVALPPDSIAARLSRGDRPRWLTGSGIYRVEPRLFPMPRPR